MEEDNEKIDSIACNANLFGMVLGSVACVVTGIVAGVTGFAIPLAIAGAITGASFVDKFLGVITEFHQGEIIGYVGSISRGEEREHADSEEYNVPPILYGVTKLVSLLTVSPIRAISKFFKAKAKKNLENNKVVENENTISVEAKSELETAEISEAIVKEEANSQQKTTELIENKQEQDKKKKEKEMGE